jgi:uncharacterized membrane protein
MQAMFIRIITGLTHASAHSSKALPSSLSPSGQSGSVAIHVALMATGLIGAAGLGADITYLIYKHRQMQMVADAAALSAAAAQLEGADPTIEANAVAARLNFPNSVHDTTITVNNPPASGAYKSNHDAVEVFVNQPQTMGLVGVLHSRVFKVSTRAVALQGNQAQICMLALDTRASGSINLDETAR